MTKHPIVRVLALWILSMSPQWILASATQSEISSMSLSQLEERLEEIDSRLEDLASYSLRGGIGAMGYHSQPNHSEAWVEVDLGQPYPIDQIIIVPTIRRDTNEGFQADAFPKRFRVLAGNKDNENGIEIANYSSPSDSSNRIAPLVIPIPEVQASWVRLEATELGTRAHSGSKALLLSEMLIFSGAENVALRRPVKASTNASGWANAWDKRFLVDGHTPYLMNSTTGKQSTAYLSRTGERPKLTIDLGKIYPVSRIHLHAVEQGDTVPQAFKGDLGFPNSIRIKGSSQADFSDARDLLVHHREELFDSGPIMMWRIQEIACRYIRIEEIAPSPLLNPSVENSRIGFSEIELFSNGKNVAFEANVTATPPSRSPRPLSALTDGNNFFGKILPIKDWLNELAIRQELEIERPLVVAELTLRYARQTKWLERMFMIAILLTMGMFITVLLGRYFRIRQASRIRERIAADLHDELGADLHTIGLYSDFAMDSLDSREELIESLQLIREFTDRSGTAARHCVNILEAKGICEDLVEDIKSLSKRMLADHHHYEIEIKGRAFLRELKAQKRIDLFLFYKECLTNILRHSESTEVSTRIEANAHTTQLTVSDNGKGVAKSNGNPTPPSLKRRARLMKAKIKTEHTADGGTLIELTLKNQRFGFLG
ncbi:discoidin domain-containing protein [Pelagicoccus mobilis]|uniref:histidine kinase n=1 Tax=Pelagicoccus mobilis TaxID=415221 RepID=A0A934RY62_9BACT|nr:discoidin domain-containing protein [Pelagicoccus mobilis]MBK1879895.1 discoidin domain-containing protein [Pelagicoccus mobilis]